MLHKGSHRCASQLTLSTSHPSGPHEAPRTATPPWALLFSFSTPPPPARREEGLIRLQVGVGVGISWARALVSSPAAGAGDGIPCASGWALGRRAPKDPSKVQKVQPPPLPSRSLWKFGLFCARVCEGLGGARTPLLSAALRGTSGDAAPAPSRFPPCGPEPTCLRFLSEESQDPEAGGGSHDSAAAAQKWEPDRAFCRNSGRVSSRRPLGATREEAPRAKVQGACRLRDPWERRGGCYQPQWKTIIILGSDIIERLMCFRHPSRFLKD